MLLGFLRLFYRKRKSDYPSPPKILSMITGTRLKELLVPYGIKLRCPLDVEYGLPSKDDYIRFLKWYKTHAPIKPSGYTQYFNCDAFAWVEIAYALVWCKGMCPFGYLEAMSTDENYAFGMHGFCFAVDWNEKVYFTDSLEVAAPDDELYPAYEVYCQDAKA